MAANCDVDRGNNQCILQHNPEGLGNNVYQGQPISRDRLAVKGGKIIFLCKCSSRRHEPQVRTIEIT